MVQPRLHDRIRVWDIPTRFAHWAVVVLFGLCWWTAKTDHMEWHGLAGSCLLGVVLFRLGWGFVGSDIKARGTHLRPWLQLHPQPPPAKLRPPLDASLLK
jgi:cytochrome b